MTEEILINVTPMECRVALIENGSAQELFVERTTRRDLVGNIYNGKVVRVLPGMQAAFIEIGLSRTAFLHVNDMVWPRNQPIPNIFDLLHAGQQITVQVMKDMLGSKGARLTTDLSIPSRYLVLMPYGQHIGVSQRIEQSEERDRLKGLIEAIQQKSDLPGGIIVRTAAEGVRAADIERDMHYLAQLWKHVQERRTNAKTALIYAELPLAERIIRDLASEETAKIYVDSREAFSKIVDFANEFVPIVSDRISHYPGEKPLFDLHNVEEDLQRALQTRVDLKSGGYLMIDQTEAMTTIDVNTGSFVNGRNLEDIVFKTNLEATHVIARQLRLRNLGGIIIIDFIDMQEEAHKADVLAALEKMLERDHAKTKITQVSELGLVEMTRKRTRESLEHLLCEMCPTCQGRGYVKSADTICYEIFREIMRYARAYQAPSGYTVVASISIIDKLLSSEAAAVADLEHFIERVIKFQAESLYTQEQYDIVLV
jgi:ribonuclease G